MGVNPWWFTDLYGENISVWQLDACFTHFPSIMHNKIAKANTIYEQNKSSNELCDTISQIKSTKDSRADESFKSETEQVVQLVHDRDRILKKDEGSFKNGNWYDSNLKWLSSTLMPELSYLMKSAVFAREFLSLFSAPIHESAKEKIKEIAKIEDKAETTTSVVNPSNFGLSSLSNKR